LAAKPIIRAGDVAPPLSVAQRFRIARQLVSWRLAEYLKFDSRVANFASAWAALAAAAFFWLSGRNLRALASLTAAHRTNGSRKVCAIAEHILRQPADSNSPLKRRVNDAYDAFLASVSIAEQHENPSNLIGTRLLVVKSPAENERGVIIIDYTYAFAIFAHSCDLPTLARKYYLVLEPSWVGYCTPEILVYSRLAQPVFVQTNEIPDIQALKGLSPNFVPVPIVSNWWIDHRLIRPVDVERKDFDISMVSSWMAFKRHARVFAALGKLRRRGRKLRALLVGYSWIGGLTRDDIFRQAQYFGVSDQIEILEGIPWQQVAAELSRSKCHVVWSRREGSNKAIIEAMLADVPSILRAGFNFGQHYHYINPQTGCFADERSLPEQLLYMTEHYTEFSPRSWILRHMTPQVATDILNDTIKQVALAHGESWTTDLVVKTKQLKRASYWNPADELQFASDYAFVRSLCRPPSTQ
jgi:glycosyltransferase involved in cell wall biosynthesis